MLQDIVGSAGGVAVTGGICRFGSRTEEIMCGIVGYNGARPVTDFLLDALELLEYRGYDSAGLATINAETGRTKLRICAKYVRMTRNRLLVELVIHAGQRMVVSVTRMRTHIVRVMCF